MQHRSNFGTGGVLVAGVLVCLVTIPWLKGVAVLGIPLWIVTYNWFIGQLNTHVNPDGSRKKRK